MNKKEEARYRDLKYQLDNLEMNMKSYMGEYHYCQTCDFCMKKQEILDEMGMLKPFEDLTDTASEKIADAQWYKDLMADIEHWDKFEK